MILVIFFFQNINEAFLVTDEFWLKLIFKKWYF